MICPASSAVPSKTLAARKPSSGLNRMISGSFSFTTIFLLSVTAKALSARSTEILPPPVTRNVIPYCFGTAMVKSVEKSAARAAPINRTRDTAHAMARNARFMLIYPKRRRRRPFLSCWTGSPAACVRGLFILQRDAVVDKAAVGTRFQRFKVRYLDSPCQGTPVAALPGSNFVPML